MAEEDVEKVSIIPAERQKQIFEYISVNNSVQIRELAIRFDVSVARIRRDLDHLARTGKIARAHGGAMRSQYSTSFERLYSEKMQLMQEEKRRIAVAAAELVKNGDAVLLDSGTTTFLVAQELSKHEDLTVITHDLHIADTVILHHTSSMMITGGLRRGNDYHVLQGNMVDDFFRGIIVNIAFLGADAITPEHCLMNANVFEANTKKLMMHSCETKVLVADHTKFGQIALAYVCDIDVFDYVITDKELNKETAAQLEHTGIKLILV